MRKIKMMLLLFHRSFISMIKNICHLSKGQNNGDYILQTAHRLEKGLCIANPKPMWGWEKARALALALSVESEDSFAQETGLAVLHAYLKGKGLSGDDDKKMLATFENEFSSILTQQYHSEYGGSITLHKDDLMCDVSKVEKLFNSRHSIRDFSDTEVPLEKIYKAIEMANRCPSACNRQPSHVWLISQAIWNAHTNDMNQVYNAKYHLLITASRHAFGLDEINDWVVSASIFAGYLSLSLTAMGIGSCVIKKGLLNDNAYKKLKDHCGISDDEKIILEIAIGNYKDTFNVPVSNRKTIKQLFTVVEK